MRKLLLICLLGSVFIVASCQDSERNNLRKSIGVIDDSLHIMVQKEMQGKGGSFDPSLYQKSIDANLSFYKKFPSDAYADKALHKIAASYRQLGKAEKAAEWRDTLLSKFPNTYHKIGLLELQMNYYDFNRYTPKKIEYYIEKLLAIDKLPPEKRKQYEFRLKHVNLTFQQLILLQANMAKQQADSTKGKE